MMEFDEVGNPFPGLRPFETKEYYLFFGREGQSDELLARLGRTRFLAVVGTSGSGKSSLVRAGLLTALHGGLMAKAGSAWRVALVRPGGDPIGNLARALADDAVLGSQQQDATIQAAMVETTLRRSALGLVEAVRQTHLPAYENVLVVVDQFEELFRFKQANEEKTEDDAAAYVKLLLEAVEQRDLPVYVVLTMRSDFLGDCAQFWGLPEAINSGQYLIPRMTRDERRSAITGPVAVGGGQITQPLVNRLLNDVGDNPDQLPILQHALMRTWDHWTAARTNGEPVGLEHYEAIGTMTDALSLHADEAFNELPDKRSREIAETIFKALTERGADNREIRRPTRLREISEIAEAGVEEVIPVIDVFRAEGRSFLMPTAGVALDAETVIDISHESLIRNWKRLKEWVNEEAQSARIYRRLAEAAILHREGSEGLLQDPALQIALDWRGSSLPNSAWGRRYRPEFEIAIAYLDESRAARDARIAAEELQRNQEIERERRERELAERYAEEQRRAAQRLRRFTFALVLISILALGAAGGAVYAYAKAKSNEEEARIQQAKAATLADNLSISLKELKAAKYATDIQAAAAAQSAKAAQVARALSEFEKDRADNQNRLAQQRAREARASQKVAEKEAIKNKKAREANDMFREGVTRGQRGDYDTAHSLLKDAADVHYPDPDVANYEAVADTRVQLGNLSFAIGYDSFVKANGDFQLAGPMHRVGLLTSNYDEAAKIYAGQAVNAPEKAGAALYTLATMLLKFTNYVPTSRGGSRKGTDSVSGAIGLGEDMPNLKLGPRQETVTIIHSLEKDPKPKIENEAIERYRRAFEHYHRAYKNPRDSMGALQGMKQSAFQVGSYYLNRMHYYLSEAHRLENTRGSLKIPRILEQANINGREAVAQFEKVLSFYQKDEDKYVARLLVWMGGLHEQLGEAEKAKHYFDRAFRVYESTGTAPYASAAALADIAEIATSAGQTDLAADFYEKALEKYRLEGSAAQAVYDNLLQQANTHYTLGRIYEDDLRKGTFAQAIENYRQSVEKYRRSFDRDKSTGDPRNLLYAGAAAKGINDYRLALDAFELVVRYRTETKSLAFVDEHARAQSEIGSVYALMGHPGQALDAYEKAAVEYKWASSRLPEFRDEAEEELERIEKVIAALKAALPKKQ